MLNDMMISIGGKKMINEGLNSLENLDKSAAGERKSSFSESNRKRKCDLEPQNSENFRLRR